MYIISTSWKSNHNYVTAKVSRVKSMLKYTRFAFHTQSHRRTRSHRNSRKSLNCLRQSRGIKTDKTLYCLKTVITFFFFLITLFTFQYFALYHIKQFQLQPLVPPSYDLDALPSVNTYFPLSIYIYESKFWRELFSTVILWF